LPKSNNNQDIVRVENLWKVFGPQPQQVFDPQYRNYSREKIMEETGSLVALRDVSFAVKPAELYVIMGLSGSGKSTLIRCVLRLIEPTAGNIHISGQDICKLEENDLIQFRRHKVSMVFQHFGLLPHRTVKENVAFGLKIRGTGENERNDRALEMIEKVGLKGWENHYPNALSGGMQQRVGIARALASDPEILLMDEPFSGLDPLIRRQMQDELIDLQAELQKTILFVTHDLDEAIKLGSYIAIMKDGEIIQSGVPEEVVTQPAGDYVREFVQDASPTKVISAASIMTDPDVLVYDWQGPKAALHMLKTSKQDFGYLVKRNKKYLGLVTAKKLANLIKNGEKQIIEAVEPDIAVANENDLLEDLIPLSVCSLYPIPVVDEKGGLIGEIGNESILSAMVQYRENEP
jgi:glycine betaine/proline transport system ATP-binding protein